MKCITKQNKKKISTRDGVVLLLGGEAGGLEGQGHPLLPRAF